MWANMALKKIKTSWVPPAVLITMGIAVISSMNRAIASNHELNIKEHTVIRGEIYEKHIKIKDILSEMHTEQAVHGEILKRIEGKLK